MKYEKKVIIIMNILKTTKLNNESFLFKTLSLLLSQFKMSPSSLLIKF